MTGTCAIIAYVSPTTTTEDTIMLYFAYGSNLCTYSMSQRCPAARPVGTAMLMDWRMTFRGVADVEPAPGEIAYGAVWQITRKCEDALDRYEGVSGGFYSKEYMTVETESGPQEALVYVMNYRYIDNCSMPSKSYLGTIARGYRDFNLPDKALSAALNHAWHRVHKVKGINEFVPHGPKRMGPAGTERRQPRRVVKAERKRKVAGRQRQYAVTTRSGIPLGVDTTGMSPATRALWEADNRYRANQKAARRTRNAAAVAILAEDRVEMAS